MVDGRRQRGFTLIELITVIVLLGVLATTTAVFLVQPFQAAADISRRAELVDEADLALARISREVRTALPNSVRVTDTGGDRFAVEFVSTRTGGRYRRSSDDNADKILSIPSDSGTFDVLGPLPNGGIDGVADGSSGACGEGNRDCISVYNTGQKGLDIYNGDNLAAVAGKPAAPTATSRIRYESGSGNGFGKNKHSPRQRFSVVDDVVSFVCDTNSGTLRRRATYGLKPAQPIAAADFSGAPNPTNDLMARDVSECSFSYTQGASSRAGLLTLTLTLERDGETVELLKQVHVMNAP